MTVVLGTAVAACLAGGVVAALVLPGENASTLVLHHPVAVTVTTAAGVATAGRDGEVLAAGDVVTVARSGRADVSAGSRHLYATASSAPTVVALQSADAVDVRQGSVVAVNPTGRAWTVAAGTVSATSSRGALRVDRALLVSIASYSGTARLSAPSGATLALPALDQASPSGASLPSASEPLRLHDDALDALAAPSLVALDEQLVGLARSIDADPFVAAAYKDAAGTDPSERLLSQAIASAGTVGPAAERKAVAAQLRGAGGSWGVVSASLGASFSVVRGTVDGQLNQFGQPAAATVADTSGVAAVTTGPTAPAGSPTHASPTTAAAATTPASTPSTGGLTVPTLPVSVPTVAVPNAPAVSTTVAPTPTVSPTPGLLTQLLNTVTGLLPTPKSEGKAASPAPAAPAATPSASAPQPLASLGSTVSGLLGGH